MCDTRVTPCSSYSILVRVGPRSQTLSDFSSSDRSWTPHTIPIVLRHTFASIGESGPFGSSGRTSSVVNLTQSLFVTLYRIMSFLLPLPTCSPLSVEFLPIEHLRQSSVNFSHRKVDSVGYTPGVAVGSTEV